MPKGELYINGKDAYTTWGMSMDNTSLSSLMTPPPMKDYIENKSRIENGKSVITTSTKIDERSLTLVVNISAKNESEFFNRYLSFCEELEKGALNIETKYQSGVVYKTIYISCNQFTQLLRGIAKFSLKLVEPNPKDRSNIQ